MTKSLYILTCVLLLLGCNRTPVIQVERQQEDPYKENMINANKYIASSEKTQIEGYVSRHQWNMVQLSNGVWLQEYQVGKGSKIDFEDTVTIKYHIEALNGSTFYDNEEATIVVGRQQATVGLDRALMELRHGSKARIILPSDLGYGVVGDGDRIPSRAVLIYDIQVL